MKKQNTGNDYEKHIDTFSKHFEAICGEDWRELTMAEAVKLLARQTLGVNGGSYDQMADAAETIGFDSHNIIPVNDGTYQVLAMIEFHGEETVVH